MKKHSIAETQLRILRNILNYTTAECYWNEACERFFMGGNRKPVWVKA